MNTAHRRRLVGLAHWLLGAGLCAVAQAVVIPSTPLFLSAAMEPNLFLTLDDSGSMHWEFMPDEISAGVAYLYPPPNGLYGGGIYFRSGVDTDPRNHWACFLRSSHNNTVYYDPAVRYRPWSRADGTSWPDADPRNALYNPAIPGLGGLDLTREQRFDAWSAPSTSRPRATRYFPATHFRYVGDPAVSVTDGRVTRADLAYLRNCARYEPVRIIPAAAPFPKAPGRTDCAGSVCTYEEEIRNFANWFSYHRSRILAARAGIGRAFAQLPESVRVGFGAINSGNRRVDGVSSRTVVLGVRGFSGAERQRFFDTLYGYTVQPRATPLRRAADDVGRYFLRGDDRGPWSSSPGRAGGTRYACRSSFHILTTDGYWNSSSAAGAARANNDGTPGPLVTGPGGRRHLYRPRPPFADRFSDTLADVAMHYWKRDLQPALPNVVPTSPQDPAFWQHLVTFGIALGKSGTIDPAAAFRAVQDGTPVRWPDPRAGAGAARVDDLLHAAVNSRGGFFTADTPDAFAQALVDALNDVIERTGSGVSVASNSTSISTGTHVYQATFNTAAWTGEVVALPLTPAGVGATPVWRASARLPAAAQRRIFTRSGGRGVPFLFSSLSAADRNVLGDAGAVAHLRGEQRLEQRAGGPFRNRPDGQVLGDVVHSSPRYVKASDTVFVGANDGMLHAFDGSTGVERFAYLPGALLGRVAVLTRPDYGRATNPHRYFVDGEITVSSDAVTPGRRILAGLLGRGGKGLFVLDVTRPAAFSAADALWEYADPADPDLGRMLGRPLIVRMNDGSVRVVVGNGYNSTSGKAVLYLFDLYTGTATRIDTLAGGDNGLGSPGVFDEDGDGDVDWIYAGDLAGNLWKFDVRGASPAAWRVAHGSVTAPRPMFRATAPDGSPQPLTAPVSVAVNDRLGDPNRGRRFVFFGTGSYFGANDPGSRQIQSWYGLIDTGAPIAGRGAGGDYPTLVRRRILSEGRFDGRRVRVFDTGVVGDMNGREGWHLDFDTWPGERIVTASSFHRLAEPVLVASSIVPVDDACVPGGRGFVNAIDPFSGARLSLGFFDLDENGDFDNDRLGGQLIGGVDPGVGLPSEPLLVGERLVVGGSSGRTASMRVNLGVPVRKGRFMWRELVF